MQNLFVSQYDRKTIGLNLLLAILFILWPLSAFVLSIITYKNRFSKVIFMLFWGLWGFSRTLISTHDSTAWTLEFIRYNRVTFNEFIDLKIRSIGAESTDFLYSLFLFIVNKITDSTAWFWLINSILFLFIYIKCYAVILNKTSRNNIYLFILFLLFIFFIPPTAFGVRFYYAALIYIYSVVKIIIYDEKKFFFLLILTPLIHFSFFIGFAAYLYYHFTHNRSRPQLYIYALIFVAIIFGFTIQFTALSDSFESISAFEQKIEGYGETSDRADHYASRSTFLIVDKLFYTLYALFVVVFIRYKQARSKIQFNQNDYGINNFNYFLLVFFSSLLLFLDFPDVLSRFGIVFTLMTILYFTRLYVTRDRNHFLNNLTIFAIVFWGFHLIVNFRRSLGLIDLNLLKGSLISVLSGPTELTIIY